MSFSSFLHTLLKNKNPIKTETILTSSEMDSNINFGAKTFHTIRCLLKINAVATEAQV